jgi:hypothetical protein
VLTTSVETSPAFFGDDFDSFFVYCQIRVLPVRKWERYSRVRGQLFILNLQRHRVFGGGKHNDSSNLDYSFLMVVDVYLRKGTRIFCERRSLFCPEL